MTLPLRKPVKAKRYKSTSGAGFLAGTTLALVNAIMLAGAAHGESTDAPAAASSTNAPAQLPDVLVTGQQQTDSYKPETASSPKYTEPLLNVPQTVTVIPQSVFEEQGATSLRDVLRNVPGISIQAGEGGVPAGDNLSIRGFNARTDLFIDGIRDFGGYARDPFNFEQVEVTKGPASAYAGRGSTGGSVNLVSKTPHLEPLYSGSLGLGSDEYVRATFDMNQPIKNLPIEGTSLRLNGLFHHADTPGRDIASNKRWGVAPSIAFGLGTPTRLTLSYFHLEQDNMPDYGIPFVASPNSLLSAFENRPSPVDFSNYYGLKARDYERVDTDIVTAAIEHDFNESISLRNVTRYGQTRRDSIITAPRYRDIDPAPEDQFGLRIRRSDWKSRDQIDEILANQTDLTSKFEVAKMEHTLVTGIEYDHEKDVNHNRAATGPDSPSTSLFNPNPDDPYREAIRRDGARVEARADTVALYAFDTIKLGEKWQLNGGLRWEQFNLDFTSRDASGAFTNGTPSSRTDRMLSGRGGVVFKPLPNGSLYAAYGTSFNPSAEGLSLSTDLFAVDPEESRTYEVGTKWEFLERRLILSAAVFRTEKHNARTEDPVTSVVDVTGEQRVDGFEFGVAGSITEDWKVFGGYTFLDSEILKSKDPAEVGRRLGNAPQHSFSLWTTYQFPWNIEVGAGAQYIGERNSTSSTIRTAPDYWLGDAMVAYSPTKNVTFRVNIYNLTDENYVDRVGGGHFIPGAGRSVVVTGSFRF
jgi:catecholate siderophore receptor